jgi:hypothetical protein
MFLNAADGVNSLYIGNSTADSSGTNFRVFCTSGNPYFQFYGGPLTLRYGSTGIGTLTGSGDLSLAGKLTVSGSTTLNNGLGVIGTTNLGVLNVSGLLTSTGGAVSNTMSVSGKLTAATMQSNYGTFSVNGTGSDTNLLSVTIPNPTTVQCTTIHINFSHVAYSTNVYQAYVLINSGDIMNTNLWKVRYLNSSGWIQQDNDGNTAYANFATDIATDTDVHLRLDIYKRFSSKGLMEVTCDHQQIVVGGIGIPCKTIGNVYTFYDNITISSVTLRTSTYSGKVIAGSYAITQRGVA